MRGGSTGVPLTLTLASTHDGNLVAGLVGRDERANATPSDLIAVSVDLDSLELPRIGTCCESRRYREVD